MKYQLVKPDLSIKELSILNFIATYLGYNFKYEFKEDKVSKAFFENELDKNIGYIQKDNKGKMFIVWKLNENIEYVDKIFNIVGNLKTNNILPDNLDEKIEKIKMALGINNLTHTELTPKMQEYLCLK